MNPSRIQRYHPAWAWLLSLTFTAFLPATAQPYINNDLTPNFSFHARNNTNAPDLKSFDGDIVILAFFTQWCQSCRRALELLNSELSAAEFRNQAGVPIRLIGVNLESELPDATDQFVMDAGLDYVVDDFEQEIWDRFTEALSIPLFIVINGVPNSPSNRQWEVVHKQIGLSDSAELMSVLDGIAGSAPQAPRINPFADLNPEPHGWREVPWFGRFNDKKYPWIYHQDHGWLYIARQSTREEIYAYDSNIGWLFFARNETPNTFSFTRNTWLRHDSTRGPERQFFDPTVNNWLTFPNERVPDPGGRNGFIYTNAQIPTDQILSGGPPRDGIPAILEPKFVSQEAAAEFMEDDDVVISVTHDGETRAYPFRILNWHEIVNDHIGDLHFAATYCPLCGTAIVFDRRVNDRLLTFGVSGLLYLDNVLMYDHQTESLWSQLFLQGVTGPQFGTPLTFVPSQQLLYRQWRERYPDGRVLSTETGHDRDYSIDPYARYFLNPDPLFPVGDIRNDLEAKAWVFGVIANGKPIAFARDFLPSGESLQLTFNEVEIDVIYDAEAQNILVTDRTTGEQLTGLWSFWFAWQAFHPETELWIGNE